MATIQCPFLGIIPVKIATLTTTYTPISSNGNPDPRNIQYVEGKGFTGSPAGTGEGINCNVLQIVNGALVTTNFTLGSNTGTADDFSGTQPVAAQWLPTNGGTLIAIGTNANVASTLQPIGKSYAMPLNGTQVLDAAFPNDGTQLELLPTSGSNNATPGANLGWNAGPCVMPTGLNNIVLGCCYSWQVNLNGVYGCFDGINNAQGVGDPGFGHNNFNVGFIQPDKTGKKNNVWFNTSSTGGANWYLDTDLTAANQTGNINSVNFVQPASSTYNFQTNITGLTGHQNFSNTSLGFLQMYNSGTTITVNGVTLPGFGFLMLPDMSGYYLLEIESTDSGSANWNSTSVGGLIGKIDYNGYLWLKQTNNHSLILASVAPVSLSQQSPQQIIVSGYVPIPIPHQPGLLK